MEFTQLWSTAGAGHCAEGCSWRQMVMPRHRVPCGCPVDAPQRHWQPPARVGVGDDKGLSCRLGPFKYLCRAVTGEEQCPAEALDCQSRRHHGSLSPRRAGHWSKWQGQQGPPCPSGHCHQPGAAPLPPLASPQLPPGGSGHGGGAPGARGLGTPLPVPSIPLGAAGAPGGGGACSSPAAPHDTLLEDGGQQTPRCPLPAQP